MKIRGKRILVPLLVVSTLLALHGCAMAPTTKRDQPDSALIVAEAEKQREIALDYQLRQHRRLFRVGYPLLASASFLCQDRRRPGIGWLLISKADFKDEMRDTAIRRFALTDVLRVFSVVANSPAAVAGIREGDVLVRVGEHAIQAGDDAEKALAEYLEDKAEPGAELPVVLLRDGQRIDTRLSTDVVCSYGLGVNQTSTVNAYADGDNVVVTKGMMRFAETDQELALVVAHELAHNGMAHIDAKTVNSTGGLLLDILAAAAGVNTQGLFQQIGAQAYSQGFESEADYVGLYIMARARLPLAGAADFWRRMAAEHPASIRSNHAASHPASPERFVAIEQTIREIEAKQAAGSSLVPEYEKTEVPSEPDETGIH